MPLVCPKCGGKLLLRRRSIDCKLDELTVYCENQIAKIECNFEFNVTKEVKK